MVDVVTAEAVARHIRGHMLMKKQSKEEVIAGFETTSPEYAVGLRELIAEAEEVLKCPIEDYGKT